MDWGPQRGLDSGSQVGHYEVYDDGGPGSGDHALCSCTTEPRRRCRNRGTVLLRQVRMQPGRPTDRPTGRDRPHAAQYSTARFHGIYGFQSPTAPRFAPERGMVLVGKSTA